ncbi:MAG: phage minor head protein [Pseudomonadota bacterium]
MKISLTALVEIRDKLHNLDFNNQEHQKIYDDAFFEIITDSEEFRETVYGDRGSKDPRNKGKKTIGYGFNMDDNAARRLWTGAFGDSLDFDEFYDGKEIEEEHAQILFNYVRDVKRQELKNIFGADWDKLKGNERIMLEDIYYNSPRQLRKCIDHIKLYLKTSDVNHLISALEKIKSVEGVDASIIRGIQVRRNAQYILGSSPECPWYRKPNQHPLPNSKDKREIVLGETIIPYKHSNENCFYSEKYYIWRTSGDAKVRATHRSNEGKMFSTDNPPATGYPGQDYNCRCFADHDIPGYVVLPEYKLFHSRLLRKDSLEHFIRFGNDGNGGGAFLII